MKKNKNFFSWGYIIPWERTFRIMKVLLILLTTSLISIASGSYSQTKSFSLDLKNVNLLEVFNAIESQSDMNVAYDISIIDLQKKLDVYVDGESVETVLDKALENSSLSYKILNRYIIIKENAGMTPKTSQQTKSITGNVTDDSEQPLPGVSIVVKGTTTGTITDFDGKFLISDVPGDATLIFSFVGMKSQEIAVAGQSTFNITMEEDAIGIEEIIAVGYGVQKKVNLTGSISTVNGEELAIRTVSDTRQALQGVAPGLNIIDRGGAPGEERLDFTIRGQSSISAKSSPLILVDGIEMKLNDVNPNDVEGISVLKDAASASIYGSRAANGVILITTKRGKEGHFKTDYHGYFGIQTPATLPELLDAENYLNLVNEALVNAGQSEKYTQEYIQKTVAGTDPINYPYTNIMERLFESKPMHNHFVRFSGGNEMARVSLSMNYMDQDGMLDGVNSKRYGIRLNTDLTINEKLDIRADISFNRRDNVAPYGMNNAISTAMNSSPATALKYPNGTYALNKDTGIGA